jgi:hypothetical protein
MATTQTAIAAIPVTEANVARAETHRYCGSTLKEVTPRNRA